MLAGAATENAELGYGLAQTYSPRTALLAQIDEAIDEAMNKMVALREFRRMVQYQPEHVAEIIHKAVQLHR